MSMLGISVEKMIKMSTNMPMFDPAVLEIVFLTITLHVKPSSAKLHFTFPENFSKISELLNFMSIFGISAKK